MALQKQVVRMSAEGGLDTKTDEKNVLPTNYLELENVRFTKTGSFMKRPGYAVYTNNVLGSSSSISDGQALATFKDELLRYSDSNLYSYSNAEDKWISRGRAPIALADNFSVYNNGDKISSPMHATISNLTCYVYRWDKLVTNGVDYRIIDNVTGTVIATGTVASGGDFPAVYAINGKFFIYYSNGGDITFKTVSFSTPSAISSPTVVITADYFTIGLIGDRTYVVTPGVTGLNVNYVSQDSVVNGPFAIPDATGGFTSFAISQEQGTLVRITYGKDSAGKLMTALYSYDLNYAVHAPVQLAASLSIWNIGSVNGDATSASSYIFASVVDAPYRLNKYIVSSDGTILSSGTLLDQATLQSKPQIYGNHAYFVVSQNTSYLAAGPEYNPYRTYVVYTEEGKLVAKFAEEAGVFLAAESGLPSLNIEGNKLTFTGIEPTEIQANLTSAGVTVPTQVKEYIIDFSTFDNYFDSTLGENLHISGGILKMYDGNVLVEHNFLLTPQAPRFVSETPTGAVLPNGTYQYLEVYKWTDKAGQVHRGSPSLPLTYTVTGGPKKPTIRIFTLPFTDKTNVELEVYRTEANGTVFYKRAYNYADRIDNNTSVESITFTDTMSDAELISNEVLYTTGGILENTAAHSTKFLTTYKSRMILLLSDGYTLQYSKKREANGAVEFSEELQVPIDHFGGKGITLATMDDHVIIFKERAIFSFSGEGPNALGEQDDFREPQLITSDAGCIDPNSVVNTPNGLMFKSAKGIYLLGRNFAVEYLGAAVEAYNTDTITSANLLPLTNEVRFTTDTEKSLVYDYFHNKWAVDTNINAMDAVVYDNTFTYIRENGDIRRETPGLFSDAGSYIKMRLASSWIQMAGIQGFERFYKMLILGGYKSPHLLKVRFAYDFNHTWVNEVTVNAQDVLPTDIYGSDDTYGESSPYGGEFPLYQFRIFPKQQKCEAFRFLIEDFKLEGNGEGLTLSNFAAEVGMKPPAYKKSKATSFAAS